MLDSVSNSSILPIVGIIVTMLLPVIGWLFRRREYRQLDIIVDKAVFLVNQLAGSVKNYSILVDGKPASDQVVWVTGWIINSGDYDISERMVDSPLRLKLPKGMRWIRSSIERHSNDISCNSDIVDNETLQFEWTLLRSGEYIHFESLIESPQEEIEEDWTIDSLINKINPHSRIENIRTETLISLSQIGERYNPLRPRRLHIMPKLVATSIIFTLIFVILMRIFFPFDLDEIYGDGYLAAQPRIEKYVGNAPQSLSFLKNRRNQIRVRFSNDEKTFEYSYNSMGDLLAQQDVTFKEVTVPDKSRDIGVIIPFGIIAVGFSWAVLYMWFPSIFLLNVKRRRTAAALFALQRSYNREA